MPYQRPCDWEWSLHIPFTTSTYSRVFHDKMNGNHEAHSSMKAPKSDNDVVKLTVRRFIVHNSKGFPLLWLIKCHDWCDLMPRRRIVYELESIQLDMDWWHSCIITLVIPLIFYERSFSEFYLSVWNQLVFNQRLQLFVQSPQPYLLIFAWRSLMCFPNILVKKKSISEFRRTKSPGIEMLINSLC